MVAEAMLQGGARAVSDVGCVRDGSCLSPAGRGTGGRGDPTAVAGVTVVV